MKRKTVKRILTKIVVTLAVIYIILTRQYFWDVSYYMSRDLFRLSFICMFLVSIFYMLWVNISYCIFMVFQPWSIKRLSQRCRRRIYVTLSFGYRQASIFHRWLRAIGDGLHGRRLPFFHCCGLWLHFIYLPKAGVQLVLYADVEYLSGWDSYSDGPICQECTDGAGLYDGDTADDRGDCPRETDSGGRRPEGYTLL